MLFAVNKFNLLIVLFGILFILAVGCSRLPDEHRVQKFLEAQEAFEKAEKLPAAEQPKEFYRVATMFQGVIDQGVQSGPIYYNLGNAWLRAEEPGRALAAYHLAQRYLPLDPYIASNKQIALGNANLSEPTTPIIEYVFFWQNSIGCREKIVCSVLLAVVTVILGIFAIFMRYRWLRRFGVTLLVFTIIAVCSAGYDWYRYEWVRHAVIAVENAVPRKGNSEQYEPVFTAPVSFGITIIILDERNDWVRLRFSSGQDGWLPQNQIIEF
ncbi:MAG: SH3 domain-containing protein [Planctomycetaceae bacterium]|jgi:tetratricopeptide (TPR) repeat protein|nr:SH3 domain-containing protein [Planctomycetaceae bacterium]